MMPPLGPVLLAFGVGLVIGAFVMLFVCACAKRRAASAELDAWYRLFCFIDDVANSDRYRDMSLAQIRLAAKALLEPKHSVRAKAKL